jgi:hypothetical protein
MKRLLKSLLNLLEKKFPDKVVVTEADYQILKATISAHDQQLTKALEKFSDERLKKIEAEINKFNVSLGFMGQAVGRQPFQR